MVVDINPHVNDVHQRVPHKQHTATIANALPTSLLHVVVSNVIGMVYELLACAKRTGANLTLGGFALNHLETKCL